MGLGTLFSYLEATFSSAFWTRLADTFFSGSRSDISKLSSDSEFDYSRVWRFLDLFLFSISIIINKIK